MTDIIVIAEMNNKKLSPVTNELVTAALKMSSNCKVVVPCNDSSLAEQAAKISGVSSVIAAKSDIFSSYDAKGWTEALSSLVSEGTVICAASAQSKDLAARIAANREISVIQDVISIEGRNLSSPIYSGKAIQTVSFDTDVVISIRPNVFEPSGNEGSATVSVVDTSGNVSAAIKELVARASERLDVSEANIIISGGRGMGSPDNFSHLEVIAVSYTHLTLPTR